MAKLRFLARDDGPNGPMLVTVPGARPQDGQPPRYVGRRLQMVEGRPAYVATREPFECDSDTDVGRRLVKLVRRENSLVPADAETARECGVAFKSAAPAPKPSAKSASKGDE